MREVRWEPPEPIFDRDEAIIEIAQLEGLLGGGKPYHEYTDGELEDYLYLLEYRKEKRFGKD